MLAAPAIKENSITGTTIILRSLTNKSPKNFELSTKGFTALGKNPSTIPTIAPKIRPIRILAKRLVLKYQSKTPRFSIRTPLHYLVLYSTSYTTIMIWGSKEFCQQKIN